jgi:hypothetical protein
MKSLITHILQITLLTVLVCACGKGFQSGNGLNAGLEVDSTTFRTDDYTLAGYLTNLGALPVESDDDDVAKVRYQATIDFNFKNMAKVLEFSEKAAKKGLWPITDCGRVGSGIDLRPTKKQYKCGEVPYGDIVTPLLKKVFEVDFKGLKGEKSGVEYKVSAAKIPIYLDRWQRANIDSIDHLTPRKQNIFEISNDIMDSVFYRFSPQNGHLISNVCIFIPGLTVRSERKEIKVDAEKRMLFLKFKADAEIKVDPGYLVFDKAKVCSSFDITVSNKGPQIKFLKMESPVFTGLKHAGLKVDADVDLHGILKVIANIAKIIGIDIEEKMEKTIEERIRAEVKGRVEKVEKQDIATGKWLVKYLNAGIFQGKLVDQLELGLDQEINRRGPTSNWDMAATLEAGCAALGKHYGKHLGGNFELICRKSFELKAQLFVEVPGNRKKGCYSHYFAASDWRGVQGQQPWWNQDCKVRNYISVTVPEELTPIYSCIQEILKTRSKDILKIDACSEEVDFVENHLSKELRVLLAARANVKLKAEPYAKDFLKLISERYAEFTASN